MSERVVLIQQVTNQRTHPPTGFRIWSDGLVQRAADNPPPTETERLDVDRELKWRDETQLNDTQLQAIREAIQQVSFFDLPPRLLINYCKEDPGAAIWTVNLDGQSARVVVFDPRPKRRVELDRLSAALAEIRAQKQA